MHANDPQFEETFKLDETPTVTTAGLTPPMAVAENTVTGYYSSVLFFFYFLACYLVWTYMGE